MMMHTCTYAHTQTRTHRHTHTHTHTHTVDKVACSSSVEVTFLFVRLMCAEDKLAVVCKKKFEIQKLKGHLTYVVDRL